MRLTIVFVAGCILLFFTAISCFQRQDSSLSSLSFEFNPDNCMKDSTYRQINVSCIRAAYCKALHD